VRIVVVGSGGTGGYFGAKLAKVGEEVTFLARGAHLKAIREGGLRIRSVIDGHWSVKAQVVETFADIAPVDLVLFCVKSYDTESAAQLVRPVVGSQTAVLSLQNGVDNEDKLGRLLGADRIMGGVAYVFSNIEAPGIIAHHQLGRIVFGEMNGKTSTRAATFLDSCTRASIPAELVSEIRKRLWEKYIFQTALAGTTALTRLPVKFVRETTPTRRLWQLQIDELLTLADAERVGLDAGIRDRCITFLESLSPTNYSSLYLDLVNGRRLELEAFHGHAVRLGERHGLPTPTLFAVYAALLPYASGAPQPMA
jgi:2-dehydropantoate 2-reductase